MIEIVDLTDVDDPRVRAGIEGGLARLHAREWAHLYDPTVWNEAIAAAELSAMSAEPGLPRTLLAFDGGSERSFASLLGSVCLLNSDDLAGWEHAGPWLASLWVMPAARGRRVGAALTARCLALAAENGHDDVYLFTAGQEAYYADRGWRTIGSASANGTPALVMVRRTRPTAARRSVVSTWVGDPDFGGAYSFLRPGGSPADRDALGAEVLPGLWLAGEHTWAAAPGTMHGAWFSGERAAGAVVTAGRRRTIVIGAGLAGLAAADALHAAGVDVRVLEAGLRGGGRAATDRTIGVPLHTGGAWLHGADGHPLAQLASAPWSWTRTTTFVAGSGMLTAGEQRRITRIADSIEHDLDGEVRPLDDPSGDDADAPGGGGGGGGEDEPLGPRLRRAVAARALDARTEAVVTTWMRGSYENLYAAPVDQLSWRNRAEPYHLPGGDRLITSAIDGFVGQVSSGLDVRFGQRAASVTRNGDEWLVVTDAGERHAADAVIVAVPITVLHRGQIAFDPRLPERVTSALDRIGCGPVAKVFATFDEPFWSPHRAFWVAGPTPLPLELFVDVSPAVGVPTLCGFAVGAHAAAVETMSEDDRCRLVDRLLADARVAQPPAAG